MPGKVKTISRSTGLVSYISEEEASWMAARRAATFIANVEAIAAFQSEAIREFQSKGGKSHKGTEFAKERARKAAQARWTKAKNQESK